MHIRDILSGPGTKLSFEFCPPRSPGGGEILERAVEMLGAYAPSFVSITYGAGGSTRDTTREWVSRIKRRHGFEAVPHLTCVNHGEAEIDEILEHYAREGVGNVLALRGDPPRLGEGKAGDFRYAADLVRHIRKFGERGGHFHPGGFGIGVAGFPEGHPSTPNRLLEMDYLKAKVDAGADYICTQLCFDNAAFHDFRARCDLAGIRVPILAGIMPVTTPAGLRRMAELSGGTCFPAKLLRQLARAGDDPEAYRRVGIHYATEQCLDLLYEQVDGIHLYTLNQGAAVKAVLDHLGMPAREAAA